MFAYISKRTPAGDAEILNKAAAFAGRPRERIVALLDAEATLCHLQPYQPVFWRATGVPPQNGQGAVATDEHIGGGEKGLISRLVDVIIDAVRTGDLHFPNDQRPADRAVAACILALGIGIVMDTAAAAERLGRDGFQAARDAVDEFLDTQGWRPLSTEWDYGNTRERVRRVLLAHEEL